MLIHNHETTRPEDIRYDQIQDYYERNSQPDEESEDEIQIDPWNLM